jgi:hypothetical protein
VPAIVATLEGSQTKVPDEALEDLRTRLRGRVLTPSDSAFDETRAVFNAMHSGRSGMTVECLGTADVVDAVNFAREHGLFIGVRGGGHSVAGLSAIQGGMLIDLSPMRGVQVDPERRLAHVQGGALLGDVDRETQAFGLATVSGRVSDTGVAGLTLGGGYGWLDHKYGLASDNIVEAQVVCADGQVRAASADSNPDLYWALRGGGGNFGIVTSFTFRLHPLGPIVAFTGTFYPAEDIAPILRGWREFVTRAPDEITSIVVAMTFPADPQMPEVLHDRAVAIVGAVHAGDVDEGMQAMQPLRELATPLFDLSQPMPYTAVQTAFDPLFPRNQLRAYWKSTYLDDLSDDAIASIAEKARNRPSPRTMVNTFHLGGAAARIGPEDTRVCPTFSRIHGQHRRRLDGSSQRRRTDRLGARGLGRHCAPRDGRCILELHRPSR